MAENKADRKFKALNIVVVTVSDSRSEENDTSGTALVNLIKAAGHKLVEKRIIADDVYLLRAAVSAWIADDSIHAIITTGGTGITGRDTTPEALHVLFDKTIEGFGELFRSLSYTEIASSTIQSRAIAGVANSTFMFSLPGSTGACRTAWNKIISHQLDYSHRPCNLVELMPRLNEK